MRTLLKSKIHRAVVTEANKSYIGSITIDASLMKKVDIWDGEKVLVANIANGQRLETYVIKGEPNSGVICVNGAGAHQFSKGDEVIIMAFATTDTPFKARKILVNKNNKFEKFL